MGKEISPRKYSIKRKEKDMKVFLIGSHGAGKTTLVQEIEKELEKERISHIVVPELPRFLMENLIFHWSSLSFTSWVNFQRVLADYYYFVHQLETDLPVLSDRSLLDVLAYVKFGAGKWEKHLSSYLEFPEFLFGKTKSVLQQAENYFYSLNNLWQDISQQKIEELLQEIIKEFSVSVRIFTRQDLENIKNEIVSLFMEQGNRKGVIK